MIIFPEGTRVRSQQVATFMTSGAALAKTAAVPILPVRHNAGQCWPAGSWLKTPGTITIVIGPTIATDTHNPRELTKIAEQWVAKAL